MRPPPPPNEKRSALGAVDHKPARINKHLVFTAQRTLRKREKNVIANQK